MIIMLKGQRVKPFCFLSYRKHTACFYQLRNEIVKVIINFPNYKWEANFINLATAQVMAKEHIGNYIYCTKTI